MDVALLVLSSVEAVGWEAEAASGSKHYSVVETKSCRSPARVVKLLPTYQHLFHWSCPWDWPKMPMGSQKSVDPRRIFKVQAGKV